MYSFTTKIFVFLVTHFFPLSAASALCFAWLYPIHTPSNLFFSFHHEYSFFDWACLQRVWRMVCSEPQTTHGHDSCRLFVPAFILSKIFELLDIEFCCLWNATCPFFGMVKKTTFFVNLLLLTFFIRLGEKSSLMFYSIESIVWKCFILLGFPSKIIHKEFQFYHKLSSQS